MPRRYGVANPKDYDFVRGIGKGGQGQCVLVQERGTQKLFVRKTMHRPMLSKGQPTEVRILCDILPANRRIVHLAQAAVYPDDTHLHLEYCNGGDLAGLIKIYAANGVQIPEGFLWHVFIHLSEALAFIHYGWGESREEMAHWRPVLHRDIKPENVFLMRRKDGGYPDVILGDFGLAAVTTDSNHKDECRAGTFCWQPPELPIATRRGDVYSLGAIIYAMAFKGDPPIEKFPPQLVDNVANRIKWDMDPKSRIIKWIDHMYSKRLQDFMLTCLDHNPSRRITSWDLVHNLGPVGRKMRDANHQSLTVWALPNPLSDAMYMHREPQSPRVLRQVSQESRESSEHEGHRRHRKRREHRVDREYRKREEDLDERIRDLKLELEPRGKGKEVHVGVVKSGRKGFIR